MAAVAAATPPSATYRGSAACARDAKSLTAAVREPHLPCPGCLLLAHRARADPIDVLTGDSQGLAAGCEKRDAGVGAQQYLRHAGRRVNHMLAVSMTKWRKV